MKKTLFKEILSRFFIGFAFAEPLGTIVNLVISACVENGGYNAVMPQLRALFSTEIAAVFCQFMIVGMIGVVFAEAALVFTVEKLSTMAQYALHFCITAVFYVPFVCLCWMPQTVKAVLIMLGNFLLTYCITYTIQYRAGKRAVEQINRKLREVRENEHH